MKGVAEKKNDLRKEMRREKLLLNTWNH